MKVSFKILMTLYLVLCTSLFALDRAMAKDKPIEGVQLESTQEPNGDWVCVNPGVGCSITYTTACTIISSPDGHSWIISGTVTAGDENYGSGEIPIPGFSGGSFTFASGAHMNVYVGDFFGVPNLVVDFSGVGTDGAGRYSISVPQ